MGGIYNFLHFSTHLFWRNILEGFFCEGGLDHPQLCAQGKQNCGAGLRHCWSCAGEQLSTPVL